MKLPIAWTRSQNYRPYLNLDDQWVGRYRCDEYDYYCPLPCVVIRIPRASGRHRKDVQT